jgi:hypothetical protein
LTRTRAVGVLERLQLGTGTVGEVAVLAAEVLANPPPLMATAQRYLRAMGTEHEGAAAVAFLSLLVDAPCRGRQGNGGNESTA